MPWLLTLSHLRTVILNICVRLRYYFRLRGNNKRVITFKNSLSPAHNLIKSSTIDMLTLHRVKTNKDKYQNLIAKKLKTTANFRKALQWIYILQIVKYSNSRIRIIVFRDAIK